MSTPPKKREIVAVEASFSGPLPPPDILKGYEDVCPGAAQRMLAMVEQQGEHRRRMEEKALDASIAEMRLGFSEARFGQICAVVVAIGFIFGGVYIAMMGHPWQGRLLGGGGVGIQALVSIFIKGRGTISTGPDKPLPPQSRCKDMKKAGSGLLGRTKTPFTSSAFLCYSM